MATAPVRVLLVAENGKGFSPLQERLEDSGCQCQVASSCLDGAQLIAQKPFDLVVCSDRAEDFGSLLDAARSSSASLFRYLLVEDGCWWVPSILRGRRCSRAVAFRDREFSEALDQLIKGES
jgi:hypothetical protein